MADQIDFDEIINEIKKSRNKFLAHKDGIELKIKDVDNGFYINRWTNYFFLDENMNLFLKTLCIWREAINKIIRP